MSRKYEIFLNLKFLLFFMYVMKFQNLHTDPKSVRLSGMWSIEEEGYMILPELWWI